MTVEKREGRTEDGWTKIGFGLDAKYDGTRYVDIRNADDQEKKKLLFISKDALEVVLQLFPASPEPGVNYERQDRPDASVTLVKKGGEQEEVEPLVTFAGHRGGRYQIIEDDRQFVFLVSRPDGYIATQWWPKEVILGFAEFLKR